PQQLVVQPIVGELVDVTKEIDDLPGVAEGRRHELQQRLGKVGGDVAAGESRAKRRGMREAGQHAVGADAQGLLLDTLQAAPQDIGGRVSLELSNAAFKELRQSCSLSGRRTICSGA